jgi:hypothetical protein
MKLNEAQLRKIIREELLKEIEGMEPKEEEGKIYPGAIAGGVGVAGVLFGINKILMDIQTSSVGGEIAGKIEQVSDKVQQVMQMLGLNE